MKDEIILQPEELYFLGQIMKGRYINYSYVAAMHDIEKNYQKEYEAAVQNLARKGILRKRLNGTLTVSPKAEMMLKNIFFGRTEGEFMISNTGSEKPVQLRRYHFGENGITAVTSKDGHLTLALTTSAEIENTIAAVVGRHPMSVGIRSTFRPEQVKRVILARRSVIDVGREEEVLLECGRAICRMNEQGQMFPVPDAQAVQMLKHLLIGA